MASLADTLATSNIGSGQELVIDMDSRVHMPDGNQTKFLNIMMKLNRTRTVHNVEFKGEESPHFEIVDQVASGNSAGAADTPVVINATDGTKFTTDYIITIKGIQCKINSIATNALTVVNTVAGQNVPALTTADRILLTGISMVEGYALGTTRSGLRRSRAQYIQNFSSRFDITDDMKASKQYGDMQRIAEETMRHKRFVSKQIEMAALFGDKGSITVSGFERRLQGGFKSVVTGSSNYTAAQITAAQMRSFATECFKHGEGRKLLFVDFDLSNGLAKLMEDDKRLAQTDETLGMKVNKYVHNNGEFLIIPHQGLSNSDGGFGGLAVDPMYVSVATLNGRGLQARYNVIKDGSDKDTNEVRAKVSIDIAYDEAHRKLIGT